MCYPVTVPNAMRDADGNSENNQLVPWRGGAGSMEAIYVIASTAITSLAFPQLNIAIHKFPCQSGNTSINYANCFHTVASSGTRTGTGIAASGRGLGACVRACERACVRACVRARVCVCVCVCVCVGV